MTTTAKKRIEAGASAAAAAIVVTARAPSPQTNERRTPKETGGTGFDKKQGEIKALAAQVYSSTLWVLPDRFIITAFVSCTPYVHVVLPAATNKAAPRAPCLTSHIPRRCQAN